MKSFLKYLTTQVINGCLQDIMAMPLVNNLMNFINQYGNILAIAVVSLFLYGLYNKLR